MRASSLKWLPLFACAAWATACGPSTPATDAGPDGVSQDVPFDSMDAAQQDVTNDTSTSEAGEAGGPLPDLTVDQDTLGQNAQFGLQYFRADACEIAEGCVAGPGWRRLLMFTTLTPNIGTADLNLGMSSNTNPNFEYSTCHMHYHYRGYADYTLRGSDGGTVAEGHKQSFCVEDLERVDTTSPGVRSQPHYNYCGTGATGLQGISVGWADDYYPNLPCQWIDVTDVPAGRYNLHVSLNYLHHFEESDYSNNEVEVPVTLPSDWGTPNTNAIMANCPNAGPYQGFGRNCGWHRHPDITTTQTCTPGETVSVGCNTACGVGHDDQQSSIDVRICEGDLPCSSTDCVRMLQQDSGNCGGAYRLENTTGVATFTCPASGRYNVLVANDFGNDAVTRAQCTIATVRGADAGHHPSEPPVACTPSTGGGDAGVGTTDGGVSSDGGTSVDGG